MITLEPDKWREVVEDAKTGGTFARSFADEIGMRGGQA